MREPIRYWISEVLALACGCSMIPEFKRPQPPVPASWPRGPAYRGVEALPSQPGLTMRWEKFITDSRLKEIIQRALAYNRDLRLAALNVVRGRALYGIKRAKIFPTLGASGSAGKQRLPGDLSGMGQPVTIEQRSVNLGVSSWEIDFSGRIRSLKEKALQEYLVTAQARRSARVMPVSEVATTFLAMEADQDRLSSASSTLDVQQSLYELIQKRFQLGLASQLDVTRARTQVEAARGDVARYTQLVAHGCNALELLVEAQLPEELLPNGLAHVSPPKRFSVRLSSEVLLGRPDIPAAEEQLRAANANIGAAGGAFPPRISLTTALGTASLELTGLLKAGSGQWSYVPQFVMPSFDAGLWSALEASKVQGEIALAQYELAIQRAFREAADALAEHISLEGQLQAQEGLVQAAEQIHRPATARYMHGLDSFLNVLDTQRSFYQAQQGLVSLRLVMLANQVRLCARLGGGGNGNEKPDSRKTSYGAPTCGHHVDR